MRFTIHDSLHSICLFYICLGKIYNIGRLVKGMDCFDCIDSAPVTSTDLNAVLISMDDHNKTDSLPTEILGNSEEEALPEKAMPGDLSSLDNLEILHDYKDNVFSRFSNSNTMMDCLSDINNSPFDITIDNDDSVLPVYGPFAQFESQPSYETDVLDDNSVPGICGLRNLGNTCFMNAGLQCLFNNKIFKEYFVETNLENFGSGTLTMKFSELMKKVWSGTYSTIHIGEFKDCFGDMYTQFRNFRQHDCQEFLALLLDTMHEELNNSNKGKVRSKADISFSNVNNCKDISNPVPSEKLESGDGKNTVAKQSSFPNPELKCDSSETSSKMSAVPNANNAKLMSNVSGAEKMEISVEANVTLCESNTEKMADLLINNKKLDKILNKNEIGICNKDASHFCNVSIKDIEKNEGLSLPINIMEKNELVSKLKAVNKIPSIQDFVKDTKTWNTNVLVSEETNNLFKFDSEKFPKHESNRLQETVDNLGQIVDLGPKQGGLKRVKITNIIHEKHKMLEKSTEPFASCTVMHKRLKIENMDANLESPSEQDDTVEMEPVPGDEYSEGSSQSSELYPLNSDCRELLVAEEIRRAYSAWDHYKSLNQSVIVDTFHGQFRSSVVCNQCSHHSITYEPFMYLPVFLPHTLERQIVLTFVQNDGRSPVRFLLNINKYDRILKIREALMKLLDSPTEEVILAEVFENHISRFLDENQSIRSINDSTRSIYAFEVGKSCEINNDLTKHSNSGTQELTEALDLTEDESIFKNSQATVDLFESSTSESRQNTELSQDCDSFKTLPDLQKNEPGESVDLSFSGHNLPESSYMMLMEDGESSTPAGPVQFHSCAICLEELPSYSLALHRNCECILCNTCIEVSCKHYGGVNFICPICSVSVTPAEDFVPLSKIQDYELKISTIPIPIVFRHDVFHEGVLKDKVLIGHPGLLKLPSSLPASKLYECVDKAIPFLSTYSLLLVDGRGLNCSRCMYNKHCSGCEISRTGDVKLNKNDSIAVRYVELQPENIASAALVVEHKSMQQTRHKTELDIYDCLDFFSERESLDEDSPWYCPVCRQNQQATKSLSVWKFPEVLIIYLKRFVFHNFVSIKVEDKVTYPLEGLDLSSFSSGPFSDELIYDLQSCVCHFGGVNAGHYTSYSKHAESNEWHYYNDENVKKEAPQTDDCVNEYIFFYQKR